MILNDKTIAKYVDSGKINVEPQIEPEQIQPASLDVRMGPKLYDCHREVMNDFSDSGEIVIQPGNLYLGHTLDYVEIPKDLAAMLTGRSSVARQGLVVHFTAGWIDPNFKGEITLEMYNFSGQPIVFQVGERIAQLVFFKLSEPSKGYNGRYQRQTGPTKPV